MGDKQYKTNSYTDFFYHAFRNVLLVSIPLLVVCSVVLSHLSFHSSATNSGSGSDNLTITISSACTLSSVVDIEHNTNTNVGTYASDIGKTTITTLCNDGNGYSVYAVGYSNNEEGNNKLINSERPEYSIDTGLNTSGLTSQWAMKLNNISDDPSPTPPTIESDYNNVYGIVPPYWTKVASRASGTTDMAQGSSFTTTYAVYASSSQYAGTYQGQVKYLLTHPSSDVKHFFMQDVADWKDQMLPNEGGSVKAVDKRDGKGYWVTRLKDGHIWMTQNLDFDINSNTTLDSTTTDLSVIYNSSTGQYAEYDTGYTKNNNIIYWAPSTTATTIDFQGNGPITGWQSSYTEPYSANKTDNTGTGYASLGNYYNWTAAIASNNSTNVSTENTVANNSICPKGWRLPSSTNEFTRLNLLYNNGKTDTDEGLINSPLHFIKSGHISDGSLSGLENNGFYWSSLIKNNKNAYRLSINNGSVKTDDFGNYYYGSRHYGESIRCIAR